MALVGRTLANQIHGDGDAEQELKTLSARFTTYVANAGNKLWRKIIETMLDDDAGLANVNHVKLLLKQVGVGQELVEALQHALWRSAHAVRQRELLADILVAESLEDI